MRKFNIYSTVIIGLLISACSGKAPKEINQVDGYFNLKALLDDSINEIVRAEATLEKQLTNNGQEETIRIDPDSVSGWERQFKLFYEADINKPGFTGAYFQEELPIINGISKKIYTAKSKKHPVQIMECTYEGDLLKEVRLSVREENAIYNATKEMNLFLNTNKIISGFSIQGKESMKMKKEMDYQVKGTVIFKSELE